MIGKGNRDVTLQTRFAQNLWSADPNAHSSEPKAHGLQEFAQGVQLIQGLIDNYSEPAAKERLSQIEDACHVLKEALIAEHYALINLQTELPDKNASDKRDPSRHLNSRSYLRDFLHPLADLACDCLIQFDAFMLFALMACDEELIENEQIREYQRVYTTRFRWIFQLAHAYK